MTSTDSFRAGWVHAVPSVLVSTLPFAMAVICNTTAIATIYTNSKYIFVA